jgi:hypothetical protein
MRRLATVATLALCLGGCQVNVDNETQAGLSNAADTVEAVAGNAADAAGTLAEKGAAKVENAADAIGNTDIDIDVRGNSASDGNRASEGNRQ